MNDEKKSTEAGELFYVPAFEDNDLFNMKICDYPENDVDNRKEEPYKENGGMVYINVDRKEDENNIQMSYLYQASFLTFNLVLM